MVMSASLIIAQYDEDVSWINKIQYEYITKIYLYTKNSNNIKPIIHSHIPIHRTHLPNIGRETHTFLHHIINNYHSLSEINIFVQAIPIIDINIINSYLDVNYITNINLTKSNQIHLDSSNKITIWKKQPLVICPYNFFEWYNLFIDPEKLTSPYHIYFESNFIVSKHHILSRSKKYYEKLLNQLNDNNTEVGHFLERSWYYIFYFNQV